MNIMARQSKLKLAPIKTKGKDTFGQRLARIRKAKGYTQAELADKMGIIQVLISDYERDKLRPYHEMIIRFSQALNVSADELLGIKPSNGGFEHSLKILRRMKKIESLPNAQQKFVLKTIDSLVKAAEK